MNAIKRNISETNVNSFFEIELNGKRLVLKMINRLKCNVKEVKRNIQFLDMLQNKAEDVFDENRQNERILTLHNGLLNDQDYFYQVTEYAKYGTMKEYFEKNNPVSLDEKKRFLR